LFCCLKFPAAGNSAGNLSDSGRFQQFSTEIPQRFQWAPTKFPTQWSREFLTAEQGIFAAEQGISGATLAGAQWSQKLSPPVAAQEAGRGALAGQGIAALPSCKLLRIVLA
jgi:hypothetical protein